ncbi:MAG: putative CRISPR-associated protein [Euryarchaeota archaeon]
MGGVASRRVEFVSTVGTSALGNLANALRSGDVKADLDPDLVMRAVQDPSAVEKAGRDRVEEALRKLVSRDPKMASAELNTLLRMAERAEEEGLKVDSIALVPTDTENCLVCARVVEEHLREEGYNVWRTEPIRATAEDPEQFWLGLSDLIERLEETGVTDPSRNVWVAASAGFKPETAVLTLVASLFGKRVFYLHEAMGDLVEIPPAMPAVTDPGFVLGLMELRRRLGDGASAEEAGEVLDDLARNEEERERYKLFLVEVPGTGKVRPSPLARLAESFLALGLLAAGARDYSVEVRAKGHTVPVSRGGGVKKADRTTLGELPVEEDTRDVLATVAALKGVSDRWYVIGEWTAEGTRRHERPVEVREVRDDAVIVSVRDRRVHISRLLIPAEDPERVARALEYLTAALSRTG